MALSLAKDCIMSSLRADVLRTYKSILRLGRTWQAKDPKDTAQERLYIETEAKRCFRENRDLSSDVAIKKKLDEAYGRVEIARHYKIPYPRPVYYRTGTLTALNKRNIKKEWK